VERVAQRLLGRRLNTPYIWTFAETLLSPQRPGDFNQAMMELGATICAPGEPTCRLCPVTKLCKTRGNLPGNTKSPKLNQATVFYSLDYRNGKVRLAQRSQRASVMAAMWELPELVVLANGKSPEVLLRLKHGIMTTNYDVRVVRANPAQVAEKRTGRRIPVAELSTLPLTGLARKILRAAKILN
jgi:A/G-specific adenine glycosylase